jgi:hypothetical protein
MGQKGERGNDATIPQNSVQPPAGPPGAPGQAGFDGINQNDFFFNLKSVIFTYFFSKSRFKR